MKNTKKPCWDFERYIPRLPRIEKDNMYIFLSLLDFLSNTILRHTTEIIPINAE